jgi:glutaconate CoA-transferase, subunit A
MMGKLISMAEAAELVGSGSTLALGGLTLYRRPIAFVKALLERFYQTKHPNNLTLIVFTAGMESDLLLGGGMVSQVRSCYFGLEIFGLAPMFTHYANQGLVKILEETEASLAFGLRAEMACVGFMPGRGWIGTDLPKLRPDVKTVVDPYSGEELIAFPAIHTDYAVIHALEADQEGNAIIGDNKGVDLEIALTAKTTIITTEKIVPNLKKADIVAPMVDALVLSPGGAKPTSCHPLYPMDGEEILAYTEQVSDQKSFDVYISKLLKVSS